MTVVVRCVRCAGRTVRAIARKGAVERVLEVHRKRINARDCTGSAQRVNVEIVESCVVSRLV